MRRILLALCFVFPVASAPARNAFGELARRAQQAAVGLSCRGPAGRYFGTGTLIRSDGLILTSSTVLPPGASEITVTFADGTVLPGRLLAVDPKFEFALAKVDGRTFPYLPLGTSKRTALGERVLTLGNAFDSARSDGRVSVGAGVVSGLYSLNEVQGEATYRGPVIETDAPLNPGSDGGALIDTAGSVIGVLSLNYSPMRYLGTAVPIDRLKEKIACHVSGPVPIAAEPPCGTERFAVPQSVLGAWKDSVVALRVKRTSDEAPDLSASFPGLSPAPWRGRGAARFLKRPDGPVSGVCIDPSGLILTSRYNIAGTAAKIEVRDADGAWHPARVLARDAVDDLSLLRAEGGRWKAAGPPQAEPIATGMPVFVLGRSPDPGALTVTAGVISAASRNAGRLFQHDAAQNAGNTGGPVIDRRGRFLGLAVYVGHLWPEWAVNSGIGFAVRGDWLKEVLPVLRKGEDVPRPKLPFLGVGLSGPDVGPVRVKVVPNQPAAKAGIRTGDRIVRIGEHEIHSWLDLRRAINEHKVGDRVEITIERNGKRKKIVVTLGERPEGR